MQNKILVISILSLTIFACMFPPISNNNDFINRKGGNLELLVNNKKPTPIAHRNFYDINGISSEEADAYIKSSGKLCFKVIPSDANFGEFRQLLITIREINGQKPYTSWKNYSTDPNTITAEYPAQPIWYPNTNFCPDYFFLTSTLKYPTLPKGQYAISISYQRNKNWDKIDLLLEQD